MNIADLQRQLGIDASFIPQFLLFIFLFMWLRYVYFQPYLKLIKRRENLSSGKSDEASQLDEESLQLETKYAQTLQIAKRKALDEKEKIITSGREEAAKILQTAKGVAKKKLDQTRAESQKNFDQEFQTIKSQAENCANQLVEKLTKAKMRV